MNPGDKVRLKLCLRYYVIEALYCTEALNKTYSEEWARLTNADGGIAYWKTDQLVPLV